MSNNQQADGEIHRDQLLNFLVNSPDEEVALTLGENGKHKREEAKTDLFGAHWLACNAAPTDQF
nr:hypothetical protein [Haladaptatus sp. W1]